MPAARTRAPGHLLLSRGTLSLPLRHATPPRPVWIDLSLPRSPPRPFPAMAEASMDAPPPFAAAIDLPTPIQLCHEFRLDPRVLCTNPGAARSSVTTTPSSSSSSDPWITTGRFTPSRTSPSPLSCASNSQ